MNKRILKLLCPLPVFSLGVVIAASFFTGCAAIQSFPQSARSGDTITLAVGSPEGMTKNNILVEYYPDLDPFNPIDLTAGVTSVFKVYPDKSSKAWLFDDTLFPIDTVAADAGHAAWLTVISLNLPALPTGTGKVKVTPTSPDVVYSPGSAKIDQVDISLEILAGQVSANPFQFIPVDAGSPISRSLSDLEPAPQLTFVPPIPTPFNGGSVQYGAVEVVLSVPWLTSGGQPVPDGDIFVLQDDKGKLNLQSQVNMMWKRAGDQFTVMFVSSIGMNFGQPRFSVVARPGSVVSAPSTVSVKYYDIDGAEIAGPVIQDYSFLIEGI